MTISVIQARQMVKDLKDREILLGRDPKTWYTYHNHVYGVAKVAKMIAHKTGTMDENRLYVMGLLHDICRTEENRFQRFHGILGYEKLVKRDPEVARICLLHSFPWDKIASYRVCADQFYHRKEDYQFIVDFIKKNQPKEEDYLIQLCDNLANKNGFVTIEERIDELIKRRGVCDIQNGVKRVNEIKRYFDQKIGCDIYGLLGK